MATIDWSKYKVAPKVSTPVGTGSPASIDWSKYQIKKQVTTPAAPESSTTASPKNRFLSGATWLPNLSAGFRKTVEAPFVNTGGAIESGLDQTLGRGINAMLGKGFTPTQSGKDAIEAANAPIPADSTTAGKIGEAAGTIAPYFTGVGEAEGAATGARVATSLGEALGKDATSFIPKVAGAIAGRVPAAAVNTALGTAQSGGNVGQGIENAAFAEFASPIMKGAGKVIEKVLPSAEKTARGVLDMISPKLTAKETAEAVAKRGTTKSSVLGRISLNPDSYMQKVADSVKKNVPDFNPSKTVSENLNATRNAVYGMADALKQKVIESGKNVIYPFKQLASKMDAVEKPIVIKSDTVLDKQFDLAKDAAMKIVQKNGGTVSSLLDSRKEFDALVQKQFPNLYEKENAPMRDAITAMRGVMNDFISDQLPDVEFKNSLTEQSHLFTAIDNMAEKAAQEVNTNTLERGASFIKNHPVVSGLGGAALYEESKKIPVVGKFL